MKEVSATSVDVLSTRQARSRARSISRREVFDVQVNVPLIHQVVVAQLAAARQGSHDTKTRAEVRGGGRKPFKQKGNGPCPSGFHQGAAVRRRRHRSRSKPLATTPAHSQKMKTAALRGALSDRARDGRVHVVTTFASEDIPSTKAAVAALASVGVDGGCLAVVTVPKRHRG